MGLLQLPVELLHEIIAWITAWSNLTTPALHTLYQFGLTHPVVWQVVERPLYAFNVKYCGSSALFWAAIHGREATARKALAADASPNVEDLLCQSPLSHAARHGNIDIVNLLLDHGADLDLSNESAQGPLYFAVMMGHKEVVELMLERRPLYDLDRVDYTGCTYLIHAAREGQTDIFELLLSKGADPTISDLKGSYIEGAAAQNGHVDTLKCILDYDSSRLESLNVADHTPLALAAKNGQLDAVELLLNYGANPNSRNSVGRTPLILATRARHIDIAKRLVQAGADVSVTDIGNNTALYYALREGLEELSTLYIGLGGEIPPGQWNWLIPAVSKSGFMNSLQQLLDMCPPNYTEYQRQIFNDALCAAVKYKRDDLIDRLLDGGCPVDPLPAVVTRPYRECKIKHVTEPTPLWFAVQQGNEELVQRLLDKGAIPNVIIPWARGSGIGVLLNLAVIKGNDTIVKALIDHGADFEEYDHDRINPLHRLVQKGRLDLVDYILRHAPSKLGSERLVISDNNEGIWKTIVGKNDMAMLQLLLESNCLNQECTVHVCSRKGYANKEMDPATYAYSKGRHEIANYLHNYLDTNITSIA